MNIQRTAPQRTRTDLQKGSEAYNGAKEKFLASDDKQLDTFDTYQKWGGRAAIGAGAATVVTGMFLVAKHAPGLEGYGAAFPPVLAGFGVGALVNWGVNKLADSKLAETGFLAEREALVEARDEYRTELLNHLDDENVSSITEARWSELKPWERLDSVIPTRTDYALMGEVDQLALLADKRDASGWQQKLAHNQDDPAKFKKELGLVQTNNGLLQTMTEGLGA